MKHVIILFICLIPFLFQSCDKDEDRIDDEVSNSSDSISSDSISSDSIIIPASTQTTNNWIQEVMEDVYLWEDEIPDSLDPTKESDSYAFFKKHIYKEDYWSWISDDYYATKDLYSGVTTTSGCEFKLNLLSDTSTVIGIVEYVLPGSPAENVGIKRGDIFTQINETPLNYKNYYDLVYMGGSYTMTLAIIKDRTLYNKEIVNITEVENFQENPIFIDTIFSISNKKIGYLMYTSYLAEYIDDVDAVFAKFKAEGITDLIIDLRYNLGGSVAAEEAMANLIVPTSAIGEIFQKSIYNDRYNYYFTKKNGDDYLNTLFKESTHSINLSGKIIGLTGSHTASASEGLLNGLAPVTDMTLIGDTTYGKYTAMTVIADKDSVWAIIPIISKTTNKDNVSVKGGMAPDILLTDNPLDGYQLGDVNETFVAKAIEQITGVASNKSITIQPSFIGKKIASIKDGKEIKPYPQIVEWDDAFIIKE